MPKLKKPSLMYEWNKGLSDWPKLSKFLLLKRKFHWKITRYQYYNRYSKQLNILYKINNKLSLKSFYWNKNGTSENNDLLRIIKDYYITLLS